MLFSSSVNPMETSEAAGNVSNKCCVCVCVCLLPGLSSSSVVQKRLELISEPHCVCSIISMSAQFTSKHSKSDQMFERRTGQQSTSMTWRCLVRGDCDYNVLLCVRIVFDVGSHSQSEALIGTI